MRTKASNGQCHRYQEYDSLPMTTSGGNRRTRAAGAFGVAWMQRITITVPTVTGKAADTSPPAKPAIGAAISAKPVSDNTVKAEGPARLASRRGIPGDMARAPPSANSQARVGAR